MRTNVYIIACLLLASLSLNAQTIFRGTVVAAGSKTPIENAKIGITNQGVGVTSNAQGAFSYKKYHETLSDTDQLIVSAPGFETIHLNAIDVRALLNKSSAIVLEKGSPQETPAITHLKIFWDISEGMQDRNLNKELAFVKQYLATLNEPKVTLEVFNKDIIRTEVWKKWDGDMDRFRESVTQQPYNAPSNYSILSLEGVDAVLLLSNGVPNYGKFNADQDIPVVPFTTVQTTEGQQYLAALAKYTSGTVKKAVAQAPVVENVTPTVKRQKRIYSGEITSLTQKISGTVKSLGKPLQGATIVVKGDLKEYTTDANGAFQVEAAAGDILLVQALGMFPKAVAVQEQNNYDIKMLPSSDQLDEVVLTARREKIFAGDKIIEGTNEPNMPGGITSLGDFYITDKDITPDGKSLERVLRDKFKGVYVSYTPKGEVVTIFGKTPNWIVNGLMVREGQPIPLYIPDNEILSIIIKDNPLSSNIKYGGEGDRGLQVLITTKSHRKDAIKNTALITGNDYTEEVKDHSVTAAQVTGVVTSLKGPLQGAEVVRKGSLEIAYTKADGTFNLAAKNGDVLIISSLGMFTKEIAVTDEKEYAVALLPNSDLLDEVVLNGAKTAKEKLYEKKDAIANKNGFPSSVILKEEFENKAYLSLIDVIYNNSGRTAPGGQYPNRVVLNTRFRQPYAVVIDGIVREATILEQLPSSNVAMILITASPGAGTKYGIQTPNGLIDIRTQSFVDFKNRDKKPKSALVTGNDYTEEVKDRSVTAAQVTGVVTSPKGPLQGAEVVRKGSLDIAYTKADGTFNLAAKNGDILIISSLGMFTKEIAVTDEKEYAVALLPNSDLLDEVVLNGAKTAKEKLYEKKDAITNKSGFASNVLFKEEFENKGYSNLIDVMNGKFAGMRLDKKPTGRYFVNTRGGGAYAVVIDGVLREPTILDKISLSNIAMLQITKSVAAGAKYGIQTPNGLIDITTQSLGDFKNRDKKPKSALVTGNDYTEEVRDRSTTAVQVTGVITSGAKPLEGAAITKKGTFNEVYTDVNGRFTITAAIDDVLVVSAPAMFTKEVLIETQDVGAITLTSKSNDLDEVVLEGRERVDNTVETAYGKTSSDKIGYATGEINTRKYNAGYTSLDQLIKGKVSGVTVNSGLLTGQATTYKIRGGSQSITNEVPPIWIVNGTPYQDPPSFLDVNQIDNISVLKSVVATSRYGSLAAGGAFIIKTKEANFEAIAAKNKQSALVSGNKYTGDVTGSIDTALPSYILRFRESGTPQQQFALYKKLSRTQESPLEYYVDAAQYFQTIDPKLADEVRSDLAYIARNNTKALRTLSYLYELVNDTGNIVLVNERIAKIAPSESQSYRDLALAYQNDEQYDKALELYINMLGEQIMGVNFNGLEKPLRSELSRLVALHKDKIDYSRLPNEWLRTDFKVDMRMTIDWSDKSVPFEFQFVNPQKKFFKWTHTLEETRDRLKAEQKEGFQTEEFIIDDAPAGEWLINVQYLGNEGDYVLPPFLKYTVYRNYGTPKETKEVRVIKLFKQVDKVTLGKVTM